MSNDQETKKLNAEELEKRAAPMMPITEQPDSGDTSGGGTGVGGTDPGDGATEPEPIEDDNDSGGGKKGGGGGGRKDKI